MQIQSTRFGTIEIREDAVLTFTDGLPGLPGTSWAFVAKNDDSPFYWLHSVERVDLAVPVTSPWLFFSDYEVRVSDHEARSLGLSDPSDALIACVVRASETDRRLHDQPGVPADRQHAVAGWTPDHQRCGRVQCPASPLFRGGHGRGTDRPNRSSGDGGCRIVRC